MTVDAFSQEAGGRLRRIATICGILPPPGMRDVDVTAWIEHNRHWFLDRSNLSRRQVTYFKKALELVSEVKVHNRFSTLLNLSDIETALIAHTLNLAS